MNKKIREAVRNFSFGDVDVLQYFCTAIAILFSLNQSCGSTRIELSQLSIKIVVLSEKICPNKMGFFPTGGLKNTLSDQVPSMQRIGAKCTALLVIYA